MHIFRFITIFACLTAMFFASAQACAIDFDSIAHRSELPDINTIQLQAISESGAHTDCDTLSKVAVQVLVGHDEQGLFWLIASNPSPWPITIELKTKSAPPSATMLTSTSERPTIASKREAIPSSNLWQISQKAFGQSAWRFSDMPMEILGWSQRIEPIAFTELENKLARLSQALSQLTSLQAIQGVLKHGDFEASTEDRRLPSNWNASLIPFSTWTLSSENARSNEYSAMFENQRNGTRGWLQSPTIPVPADGRIGATAWLKIDPKQTPPKIIASTSLVESTDQRREWKHTYNPNELVRSDNGWQRIDFPILTPQTLESEQFGSASPSLPEKQTDFDDSLPENAPPLLVRFTLDFEGMTKLWIDDFEAGRVFLDEEERRQLRSRLYVARRDLSQNRPQIAWDLSQSETYRYIVETAAPNLLASPMSTAPELRTADGLLRNQRPELRKPLFDGSRRRVR